jgi:hypothetical protein
MFKNIISPSLTRNDCKFFFIILIPSNPISKIVVKMDANLRAMRISSLLLAITAGILGILSRKFPECLPSFIVRFAGDTLWAFALYYLLRLIFPQKKVAWNFLVCLSLSFFVEISQLYQANWMNVIRNTWMGALILGNSFLWTDLICYCTGCVFAGLLDFLIIHRLTLKNTG